MSARPANPRRGLIGAQISGALLVFVLIALAPPAEGNMLLIPVGNQSEAQIVTIALMRGASLVQRGPFHASVIVYGKRESLFGPLAREGVLTITGGAVGCRSDRRRPA